MAGRWSQLAAGPFASWPLLAQLGFDDLVKQAGYPGSEMVPAISALLSLLALKLIDKELLGADPTWVYFDSRPTTYAEMNRLNLRGKTWFITIRWRGSRILRGLAKQPASAWRRTVIDTPRRRHRNIRYLEQTIHVADYEGEMRQIAIDGSGRDEPALVLSNNFDATARQILTRYTSRNGIEDSPGSGVNSFHLDCLASEVPLNVDLDAALTVLANGCYR